MGKIKQAWVNLDRFSGSLTFESSYPDDESRRLWVHDMTYPSNPSPSHPLRHVLVMHNLTKEDLVTIKNAIDDFLGQEV